MLKNISKQHWVVMVIILVGAGLRLFPLFVFPLDQPFRLGGLFYEFSRQIAINNFAFPETIPFYSAGGIPFGYPPLSFFVQAVILSFFHPPLFVTVNLIPPLITLLSLPAFYWMIRQYNDDRQLAIAGLFAFALIPPAFLNQIEAAGLAESFGMLALLLYLGFLFRWQTQPKCKDTIMAGLALGFCILSSPGSAYAATLLSVLFFIWIFIHGLRKHDLKHLGMIMILGLIGILVSAPFWSSVMKNHGVDFFIAPFFNQHQLGASSGQIEQIIGFQPAGEFLGFFWNWLILAGLILSVFKRDLLILAIFAVFWLIPREGAWLVSIPAAILAGKGLVEILMPLFKKAFQTSSNDRPPLIPGILALIFLILVLSNVVFSLNALMTEPEWYISKDQISSLQGFQDSIPDQGRVIILGNIALAEWAPVILQREVINIEYGLEWQPDELEKVREINTALEMTNFNGLINATIAYIHDQQVFLISSSEDNMWLHEAISGSNSMHLISSTPTLELHTLNVK